MRNFSLVDFSIRRPKLIVWLAAALTLLFLTQLPRIRTDTNPKHMLPETSDVRVWNNEVDRLFALYEDTIVVGVRNDAGVLNRATLGRIARLTDEILKLEGVASRDVYRQQAVAVRYLHNRRDASSPAGDLTQTRATLGIFYVLLGHDRFGTFDWR